MHERAREFVECVADEHGVRPEVREFPAGTETAAVAAEKVGCPVAAIASSIVLVVDDVPVVVVTSGANRVDLEAVRELRGGASVRMAEPGEVKDATGWSIGGVPPLCHAADPPVFFDETLLAHDTVWAAAGTPVSLWEIAPERLADLADATVASVAEP